MRKSIFIVAVLAASIFAIQADAEAASWFRRNAITGAHYFPTDGEMAGLELRGKLMSYRGANFGQYYGAAGNRFVQYGIVRLVVGEYNYGNAGGRVTIEIATMDSPTAAAGIYHYHRARMPGGGRQVEVGAEGLVDAGRRGRNLYFHRGPLFVKIIYSGDDPIPDLMPIAQLVDSKLPRGRDQRPDGFAYIRIPGVKQETIELTPGFTFNINFLPPAVWASAPGGGSIASDLFIITKQKNSEAAKLAKDYASWLRFNAEYIEEYKIGRQTYVKAVDPNQGRVVFTSYKNAMIIAARPDGYEKGEALIDLVMKKIDELDTGR
ncbi:MAG: hypothetical protein LIP23_08330 [Planctomycetes bacterium]|nr:hypothetical protein [Planctomycetota bacterium]